MQRFIKGFGIFFLVIVLILVVALLGGFFFLKNLDVTKFKPQIIQTLTQVLGRSVDFTDIDLKVSLGEGVRFHLDNFTISEDPRFGSDAFFSVEKVELGVDILPFLLTRQVSVPNILIRSPKVLMVRHADGQLNINSLAFLSQGHASESRSGAATPAALPAVFINSLRVENADILFTDAALSPAQKFSVSQLSLAVERFSLNRSFSVAVSGAVLAAEKNFNWQGSMKLNLAQNEVELSDTDLSFDLSGLPWQALGRLKEMKGVPFPEVIEGQVKLSINEAVLSDKGLGKARGSFSFANGKVVAEALVPGMAIDVNQINFSVENFSAMDKTPFKVNFAGALFAKQPNINFSSMLSLDLNTQDLRFTEGLLTSNLALLPLAQMKAQIQALKDVTLPEEMSGQLQIALKDVYVKAGELKTLLCDVTLEDGGLTLRNVMPDTVLKLTDTDIRLADFSLDKPFTASLKTAYLNAAQNITFDGSVSLNDKTPAVTIEKGSFTVDLSALPLAGVKASGFIPKGVPFPSVWAGQAKVKLDPITLSPAGLGPMRLGLEWRNGQIQMDDLVPGISLAAQAVNIDVQNFSLENKPFDIKASLGYESKTENISLQGKVTFDPLTQNIHLAPLTVQTDLGQLPLDLIKSKIKPLQEVPFPGFLEGLLAITIQDLSTGTKGLTSLLADISLKEGAVQMDGIAPGIDVAANKINLDIKKFSFDKDFDIAASLGYESAEPNISFNGRMGLDPAFRNIHLSQMNILSDLAKIPLALIKTKMKPLKDVPLPEVLQGELAVNIKELKLNSQGLISVLSDVSLKDGTLAMKEVSPGVSFDAKQLNLTVKDFTLDKPFVFDTSLGYLSDQPNIWVKGTVAYSMADQRILLRDTDVRLALSLFSLTALKSSIVALKDVSLPETLTGDLNVTIAKAAAGPQGLSELLASGVLSQWEVKLKELTVPLKGEVISFKTTDSDFTLNEVNATLGQAQIQVQMDVVDYLKQQKFAMSGQVKGLDLSEIMDQKDAPVKMEGLLFANINAQGSAADLNSITGEGTFNITEVQLKNLNVLKTVLDKIAFLPNVTERIMSSLPDVYKDKLESKDTKIRQVASPIKISQGSVRVAPLFVEADEFIFQGDCQAAFDQKYSLDGDVKIPNDLSAAMGKGADEFKYLFDESNRISLPVHVAGKGAGAPVVSVTQTALDIGKNVMRNEGKKQLESFLNKALGVQGSTAPAPELPSSSGTQSRSGDSEESVPEGDSPGTPLVDGIFNMIFKP